MLVPNGLLPGIVYIESEFLVQGAYGTCGPNALAMAESYGAQVYVGTPVIYRRMRAAGRADANGVSTMGKIQAQAQADGYRVAVYPGGGWKAWAIARLREGAPVIYEPSRGQALVDLISGKGMNARNLRYHFNLMVGYWPGGYNDKAKKNLPEGFWFSDGDNGAVDSNPGPNAPVVNGRRRMVNGRTVQFYSAANVAQSAPYTFLAVYPKIAIGLQHPAGFPDGWTDDGVTLKSPNGQPVVKGFRAYLLAHPELVSGQHLADNYPIEPERSVSQVEAWNTAHGAGSVQTFHKMRLVWTPREGVYVMWLGDEARYLEREKVGAAA